MDFLRQLFSSGDYMPHGYCYLWNHGLVWLHVLSDSLIALAYFAIPIALIQILRKRKDLPFNWMFLCFGIFLVACGSTHAMEVWNLWHASYWLAGVIKAITAIASVLTAVLLFKLLPSALALPGTRGLETANRVLQSQICVQHEVELALRQSEARLREQPDLLDLAHDAILVRDLQDRVVFWNRGAEDLYGWRREEALGKVIHTLLQTRYPKPREEIQAALIERGSWEGELQHQSSVGTWITVASRWAVRAGDDGQPVGILEINRDISMRKQAEEELRASDEKFRGLLEAAPDAMVIVDRGGRIVLVNARTESLFGYQRNELIGKPVEILVPVQFRTVHQGHRVNYSNSPLARPMGAGLDICARKKDGAEVPVEISLSPLQTGEGTLILSAIRDVTERRRVAGEVNALNELLENRVAELREANREIESFSYSVSHDLRAPLRQVDGFAKILLEEHARQLDDSARHCLQRVADGAQKMGRLVDDLLDLSRLGRQNLNRRSVDLNAIIQSVRELLRPEVRGRAIEWRIMSLPIVECDPGLLKLVFTNLLSNAVKFTRPRAQAVIEVGVESENGLIAIYVRDNGVGFDPQYAEKLFGVFQRLHRQEDFEGTGIGLATVQRIVQKHRGRIWAEGRPDGGATFYFTLGSFGERVAERTDKKGEQSWLPQAK